MSPLFSLLFLSCWEEPPPEHIPSIQLPLGGPPPSQGYQKDYRFTQDMFFGRSHLFSVALAPYKNKPNVQYLEIGVHEGRSFLWVLENIMTHPSSRLTGIDLFDVGSGSFKPEEQYGNVQDYKQRYLYNIRLSGHEDRIDTQIGYSQEILKTLPPNTFDVIYIDGCHTETCAKEDAMLSWKLLKKGGRILFDDYNAKDFPGVYAGANMLYKENYTSIRVIHSGWVLVMEKIQ